MSFSALNKQNLHSTFPNLKSNQCWANVPIPDMLMWCDVFPFVPNLWRICNQLKCAADAIQDFDRDINTKPGFHIFQDVRYPGLRFWR